MISNVNRAQRRPCSWMLLCVFVLGCQSNLGGYGERSKHRLWFELMHQASFSFFIRDTSKVPVPILALLILPISASNRVPVEKSNTYGGSQLAHIMGSVLVSCCINNHLYHQYIYNSTTMTIKHLQNLFSLG